MRYLNIIILFFFFGILLSFVKPKYTINISISGGNSENNINNINEIIYFTVTINDNYNPQLLKIIIEEKKDNINNIISFYQQDSTYTNRKQLFQSAKNKTEMLLNKEQIKNIFYFTLECSKFPCNIKYTILEIDNFELKIGNTYTYFVTEETKEMKFKIIKDPDLNYELSNIVSVWAKGNKDIYSELDAKNAIKNSIYNGYIVKIDDNSQELNYIFTIKGEIGDLINVGAFIFDKNDLSLTFIEDNILEISGFLKKNIIEYNCFNLSKELTVEFDLITFIQHYNLNFSTIISQSKENNIKCIKLDIMSEEAFYSGKIIKNLNENSMNEYQQQMLGFNYQSLIKEGQTMKLIPIKPEYDYNYLTYNIQINLGKKIKASIYSCDTYPKCEYNSNIIPFINMTSSSFSFSKNEIDQFSSSSIDKKQKVLLIKCEEGVKSLITRYLDFSYCLIEISMYTDQNTIFIIPTLPSYRYLPKFHEENLLISKEGYYNMDLVTVLNIEILSGNISINIIDENNYYCEKKGNTYLYIVNKDIFSLKIKSFNNSYYMINYFQGQPSSPSNITKAPILVGGNYLYNLEKQNNELLFVDYLGFLDLDKNNTNPIFIGIYAFCRINITENKTSIQNIMEFNEEYFYQDISFFDVEYYNFFPQKQYSINITEEKENCSLYISSLRLDNKINDNSESLMISTNHSYFFKFSPNYKIMKYSYPHTENYKDIKIDFNLLNKGNYKVYLFFNNEISKNKYEISKNESIIIKTKDFENGCNREDLVCKISFNIESLSQIESILQIKIITYNSDNNDKDQKKNDDSLKIVLIILASIIVVIIIIVIVIIIINKSKNKDLANKVNAISFVEGENGITKQNSDEKENDLLA